jgi:hypothetical protein
MKTAISIFFALFSIIWTYPGFCTPDDSIVVKLDLVPGWNGIYLVKWIK